MNIHSTEINMRYSEVESHLVDTAKKAWSAEDFAKQMAGTKPRQPQTHVYVWANDDDENPTAALSDEETAKARYPGKRYEVRHPNKASVTRYNNYMKKYNHFMELYNEYAERGLFDRDYGFDIKDVKVIKISDDTWTVWWNDMKIGYATLNFPERNSSLRSVWKTAIDPLFQRRGVGTVLYDEISNDLTKQGLTLVPSNTLSDEGYSFWKNRDPNALAQHYKRHQAQK